MCNASKQLHTAETFDPKEQPTLLALWILQQQIKQSQISSTDAKVEDSVHYLEHVIMES